LHHFYGSQCTIISNNNLVTHTNKAQFQLTINCFSLFIVSLFNPILSCLSFVLQCKCLPAEISRMHVVGPRRVHNVHNDPVAWCVSQLFTRLRCTKTAGRIEVLFELETLGDQKYIVFDGVRIFLRRWAKLGDFAHSKV